MARALGFSLVSLWMTGCSTMEADIVIRARPERVWSVLTDLDAYPEWNPFFVQAKGKLATGETLQLLMQPVGKSQQDFSPKVLSVDAHRALCWRGRLFLPFLFDGEHQMRIEVVDEQQVRFTQYEEFSGLFVPFVGFGPYREGWARMNEALKKRAEAPEASSPVTVTSWQAARPQRTAKTGPNATTLSAIRMR